MASKRKRTGSNSTNSHGPQWTATPGAKTLGSLSLVRQINEPLPGIMNSMMTKAQRRKKIDCPDRELIAVM